MVALEDGGKRELSRTAVALSQVIEREAKRSSRKFRLQTTLPSFKRHSRSSRGDASDRSAKRSAAVGPAPGNETLYGARPPIAKGELIGGPTDSSEQLASIAKQVALDRQGSKVAELQRKGSRVARSFAETNATSAASSAPTYVAPTRLQRLWLLVDEPQSSQAANYVSVCVFGIVLLSTVVFIAQTETALEPYASELRVIEILCAAVFSLELAVRIVASPSKFEFFRDLANWIDILAIFPFYLEQILEIDNAGSFGAIRIVRLTRVARVLKISRYSSAIQVFVQAIVVSVRALSMLIFLMSIAMIVFSSLVYFSEYTSDGCRAGGWAGDCVSAGAAPKFTSSVAAAAAARAASATDCVCVDPNPYTSIASSFWWCVVTMSTVGYGDMTPVTLPGKVVGCATMLTGTLVLALPISVIGTNFQKVMKTMMQQTMKSNVDFLKGKRMLCRTEIEAILQRFHAVTEDLHLDVDDVINVYDEDNNGMLEDEEIQKFRIDLEILQNRLLTPAVPGAADADRSLQGGTALPVTAKTSTAQQHRSQFNLVPRPRTQRHASVASAVVRPFLGAAPEDPQRRRAASAVASSDPIASFSSPSGGPANAMVAPAQRAREMFQPNPAESNQADPELLAVPALAKSASLDLPGVISDVDARHSSTSRLDKSSPHRHYSNHHQQQQPGADRSVRSFATLSPGPLSASASNLAAVDTELFWMRMLEMQHAWEERLLETEQRLEAKLQILTKILVRLEGRMEEDD